MSDKRIRLARRTAWIVREVTNNHLSTLDHAPSQDEWEQISMTIASRVADELVRDYEIGVITDESEIKNAKGQLNAAPVIDCIKKMAENRTAGDVAKLMHLAQHMTHVMKDLRLISTDPATGGLQNGTVQPE